MRGLLSALLVLFWPLVGAAQDVPPAPQVSAELSAESVVVGQPLVLRVTVLVPTWMPKPPVFPSFEAPNLIVRLPSRASGPVSQSVNGETWSGVSRAYRLYPMVEGSFTLPAQTVDLVYANPPSTEPVSVSVPLPPVTFTATVPEAARSLDPLIIAENLTLTQQIEGEAEVLSAGDAVTREVMAKIEGTSPLFIPPLIHDIQAKAVQAYPKEPSLSETENRGVLSGERAESTTYVARYGGAVALPEISLQWFSTVSGKVETATVPGLQFEVDAPAPPRQPLLTPRQVLLLAGGVLVLALLGWAFRRYAWPSVRMALMQRRARRLASEAHAARLLRAAIRAQDLRLIARQRALWDSRLPPVDHPAEKAFDAELLKIGEARFGRYQHAVDASWRRVATLFEAARKARLEATRASRRDTALKPLNPF
ncbi:hypothetical protein AVO45_00460 [Ruegeria marisrubri]|uniref:BatD protein n=1 Tax=Ruegeria marisrubri TaxID=1685379 RepID=A0A0X3UBP1_9RHOB|nr:BatD family protein [Ruegeria marisrubri]KUJ85505.1 hypothetical protein AVO45_00460 [Ruegeria marisrubri]